jgi:uncharacterized protein (TIRG00374 family)
MKTIPWRGAIGLALTILLLWWVFHDVDWAEVRQHLRAADPLLFAASIVLVTLIFPLRAIRWRPILDPISPKVPYGPLWRATAVGMMANATLPARVGEPLRAYMLSRETTIPFSAAFASLVVDRVFDAVVVLLLMVLAMFHPSFPAGVSRTAYAGTGVLLILAVLAGLYAIVFFPDRLIRLYELFARRVAPRFEERGRVILRSFAEGLSVLRHPGRFLIVFWWTLLHWLVHASAFWIGFRSLGIQVPFVSALFIQGLVVIGVAAPSTPGYFGPFEFAAVTGLKLYGVDESVSVAWALTYHVFSLIPITVIGLYYLARSGLKLGELKTIGR